MNQIGGQFTVKLTTLAPLRIVEDAPAFLENIFYKKIGEMSDNEDGLGFFHFKKRNSNGKSKAKSCD